MEILLNQHSPTTKEHTMTAATATPAKTAEADKSQDAAQETGIQVYNGGSPLPQNRPVESSSLKVVSTYNTMGNRPVISSGLEVSSSIVISGNRPIMKSNLAVSETYSVMGNRPVASNEIEDIATLIGYLD
ncbi:MAG: hypothetical protein F6J87_17510 [Spirulina sp. SIO3F2]|nr:hypothetical protein [Spirulina sp. SIO3F2]